MRNISGQQSGAPAMNNPHIQEDPNQTLTANQVSLHQALMREHIHQILVVTLCQRQEWNKTERTKDVALPIL
jgi:hypothetical protein